MGNSPTSPPHLSLSLSLLLPVLNSLFLFSYYTEAINNATARLKIAKFITVGSHSKAALIEIETVRIFYTAKGWLAVVLKSASHFDMA